MKINKKVDSKLSSVISSLCEIQGDLVFSSSLHVKGKVNGDIKATEKDSDDAMVYAYENSHVVGNIQADVLIIAGKINGNITAHKYIKLENTAVVCGDITYAIIEMDLGAKVEGNFIKMEEK